MCLLPRSNTHVSATVGCDPLCPVGVCDSFLLLNEAPGAPGVLRAADLQQTHASGAAEVTPPPDPGLPGRSERTLLEPSTKRFAECRMATGTSSFQGDLEEATLLPAMNLCFPRPFVLRSINPSSLRSVMFVGGPNSRTDFHVEQGAELFLQLRGCMELPTIQVPPYSDAPLFIKHLPVGSPGADVKSISCRCYLREVAFAGELT